MPPKVKTDKNMILNAAFNVIRRDGVEKLNVRSIADDIGCSTQPVMYQFKTIEEIKEAVYDKCDEFHSMYLMQENESEGFRRVGLNYIRFAYEERNLFKFLFQSDKFVGMNFDSLVSNEATMPFLQMIMKGKNCDLDTARDIFKVKFATVHGLASMIANNSMKYDESECIKILNL